MSDTFRQEEITCPYCGYVHKDSWDHRLDSGESDCEECNKPFFWERVVDVTYTTVPKDDPKKGR